jgi:hypothetical protein
MSKINGGIFGPYATIGVPRRGTSNVLWILGEAAAAWESDEPTVLAQEVSSGTFRHVALAKLRFVRSRVSRSERMRARSLATPGNQNLAGIKAIIE